MMLDPQELARLDAMTAAGEAPSAPPAPFGLDMPASPAALLHHRRAGMPRSPVSNSVPGSASGTARGQTASR